jgi:hypothetical protein
MAEIEKALPHEFEEEKKRGQEILEKFERVRTYKGPANVLLTVFAVAASLYHLYYAYTHPFFALDHRALHWFFMSILVFALYPLTKKHSPWHRMSVFDGVFLVTSGAICIWLFLYSTPIMNRAGSYETLDVVMGCLMVLLVLEARGAPRAFRLADRHRVYPLRPAGPWLPDLISHKGTASSALDLPGPVTDGIFGVPIGSRPTSSFSSSCTEPAAKDRGGEFFTDYRLRAHTGGPGRAGEGGRRIEHVLRHDLGQFRCQHGDNGLLHDPPDEAHGLSRPLRGGRRGLGIDDGTDHAADHGCGGIHHGRVPRNHLLQGLCAAFIPATWLFRPVKQVPSGRRARPPGDAQASSQHRRP